MLLFDDGKRLEKAVGEEAAQIIVSILERLSEEQKREAATKGDIAEVKHAIREAEMHFDTKMKEWELRLLKWQLSIGFAIILVMAKGFGWLGF